MVLDPIHTASEQARQDSSRQVLHSSRGIREAQGRIRGTERFIITIYIYSPLEQDLIFYLFIFMIRPVGSSVGCEQRSEIHQLC